MTTDETSSYNPARPSLEWHSGRHGASPRPPRFIAWLWFLLKNLIGWAMILGGVPLGWVTPGPLGIVAFLIGFSLITFPGKRRLTARVLHGKIIPPESVIYQSAVGFIAVLVPVAALFVLRWLGWLHPSRSWLFGIGVGVSYAAIAVLAWWGGLKAKPLVNWFLRKVPIVRRRVRPWLRRYGIDLLPRRRRRRLTARISSQSDADVEEEILEIHERHRTRASWLWSVSKPWLYRGAVVAITALIFFRIFSPMVAQWDLVKQRVWAMHWGRFFVSAAMFTVFLFAFRALQWRYLLGRFGHWLPIATTTRIWSVSELARYVPGAIWQVVGRIYLVKPYGVRGSVCSATQVLELTLFLLANVIVAVGCLVWLGIKNFHGPARFWLSGAMGMVPVLLVLVHPAVLYRILDFVMTKLHKPLIPTRMRFRELLGLLAWTIAGLLFQSMAIWFLITEPLGGLKLAKWWVVAGAYSLAWVAGFLAFWAPGGLGVRELVLVAALEVALPPATLQSFADPVTRAGVLAFLSVLLRLWATAGELALTSIATATDADRRKPIKSLKATPPPAEWPVASAGARLGADEPS